MNKRVIGVMSGTSLDGIDVVLTDIDFDTATHPVTMLHGQTYPYDPTLVEKLRNVMDETMCTARLVSSVHFELAVVYSKAITTFLNEYDIDPDTILCIACHGQTVYHINDEEGYYPSSLQLGDGSVISTLTGIPVVSNFRNADIAVGGTGAPLVPFADSILFQSETDCISLHNIGGISNLTLLPKERKTHNIIAFDTGPGNMIIDEAMRRLFQEQFDPDGSVASQGTIIPTIVSDILAHPFFKQKPPKSTGRELFGEQYTKSLLATYSEEQPEDIIASITYAVAQSIVQAYEEYILPTHDVRTIVLSGGGLYNKTLVTHLETGLPHIEFKSSNDYGFDGSFKEAIAFAILGYHTMHKLPSNVPSATGASKHVILGQISYPTKGDTHE